MSYYAFLSGLLYFVVAQTLCAAKQEITILEHQVTLSDTGLKMGDGKTFVIKEDKTLVDFPVDLKIPVSQQHYYLAAYILKHLNQQVDEKLSTVEFIDILPIVKKFIDISPIVKNMIFMDQKKIPNIFDKEQYVKGDSVKVAAIYFDICTILQDKSNLALKESDQYIHNIQTIKEILSHWMLFINSKSTTRNVFSAYTLIHINDKNRAEKSWWLFSDLLSALTIQYKQKFGNDAKPLITYDEKNPNSSFNELWNLAKNPTWPPKETPLQGPKQWTSATYLTFFALFGGAVGSILFYLYRTLSRQKMKG